MTSNASVSTNHEYLTGAKWGARLAIFIFAACQLIRGFGTPLPKIWSLFWPEIWSLLWIGVLAAYTGAVIAGWLKVIRDKEVQSRDGLIKILHLAFGWYVSWTLVWIGGEVELFLVNEDRSSYLEDAFMGGKLASMLAVAMFCVPTCYDALRFKFCRASVPQLIVFAFGFSLLSSGQGVQTLISSGQLAQSEWFVPKTEVPIAVLSWVLLYMADDWSLLKTYVMEGAESLRLSHLIRIAACNTIVAACSIWHTLDINLPLNGWTNTVGVAFVLCAIIAFWGWSIRTLILMTDGQRESLSLACIRDAF